MQVEDFSNVIGDKPRFAVAHDDAHAPEIGKIEAVKALIDKIFVTKLFVNVEAIEAIGEAGDAAFRPKVNGVSGVEEGGKRLALLASYRFYFFACNY